MGLSLADRLARLPAPDRVKWVRSQKAEVRAQLLRRPWWFLRRPEQKPPDGDWSIWLILSGRGWGKTRTGAESLLEWVIGNPSHDGDPTEWAVIGETIRDAREICVLGPSGIIRALERRGLKDGTDWTYHSTFGIITLHEHGQKIHVLGAQDGDVARGLNLSGAWLDELAKWRYAAAAWIEGIAPALRIGENPRVIVTTTPKPISLLKEWIKRTDGSVFVTRGSTFDNAVNLSRIALAELKKRYAGTRIGRQELEGELLEDVEGALWQRSQIDKDRVPVRQVELYRVVVAVDPAVSSGEDADETGIIVAGRGTDSHGYVLADYSGITTPLQWAKRVVAAYHEHEANTVVIETNQGGEALVDLLHTVEPNLPIEMVTAKKAKRVRAEPVSALYEQHRVHHVGSFDTLEDQICTWTPEEVDSPDRMDALVYAITALFETGDAGGFLSALTSNCEKCQNPLVAGSCWVCRDR